MWVGARILLALICPPAFDVPESHPSNAGLSLLTAKLIADYCLLITAVDSVSLSVLGASPMLPTASSMAV